MICRSNLEQCQGYFPEGPQLRGYSSRDKGKERFKNHAFEREK